MALQKEFLKDDPKDTTPESRNKSLAAALGFAYLTRKIIMIERVEEGETGWTVYFHG